MSLAQEPATPSNRDVFLLPTSVAHFRTYYNRTPLESRDIFQVDFSMPVPGGEGAPFKRGDSQIYEFQTGSATISSQVIWSKRLTFLSFGFSHGKDRS